MPKLSLQLMKTGPNRTDHLTTLFTEDAAEENTFMWSLVDLLTLLLIFFIFLYANSGGQIHSGPLNLHSLKKTSPVLPVQLASSPGQSRITEAIPITSHLIPPLVVSNPPEAVQETASLTLSVPTDIQAPQEPRKIADTNESIEQLREAALNAINENEDPACSIRWNQNRLVFVLGERVTFNVGEAKLLRSFDSTLKQIAGLIASKKEYKVMVSGHTDDSPIYTIEFPSNWELSAVRAITVAKLLIKNGVDPLRISIQGFAEYRPLYENSTPENKEANRRVEIALIKEENRKEDSSFKY